MAFQLDPDWPGLTEADRKHGAEVDRTEVKRIAGELEKALKALTTGGAEPAAAGEHKPGDEFSPPPPPPSGAGSLPDLQRHCALSEAQLGQWQTAQQFSMGIVSAYSVLVGDPGSPGGGLYASLARQYGESINALLEMARSYDGAEQAYGRPGDRR
ncbi:hypothetical protein Ppa06_09090 [Planomonospora parontospora subsp. parontospora]|jgi:hypothetical protein|uniref:Uncharacterized protein n=2 Tax=Planomonospora parontospora TaxID=58119 RepID=A0AA37BCA1_9ACTN|nr:hypothetical protein [Planomonospora parontospora]GGK50534.1 hypothetical protein GCM10010126_07520 [Planomonospora parontospora]GII07111.1 hypothetical protein Ppa06_09090 [Planomonospora parontospora subsp. parontospora]